MPTFLMVKQNSFTDWLFGSAWGINEGNSYPYLIWQTVPGTHNIPAPFNQNYMLDIEYNLYPTVQIGTQTWMAANLKTSKFNDGSFITNVPDAPTWASLSTPAYCWYDNDILANKTDYGALYNYYVVQSGNICPTGWHVPDNTEFDLLLTTIGGAATASSELRDTSNVFWLNGNPGVTNSTGFSARGSGSRWYFDGSYILKGTLCRIHSSTIFDTSNNYYYLVTDESDAVTTETQDMKMGATIRCIKD